MVYLYILRDYIFNYGLYIMDLQALNRELDITKTAVFLGKKNAAFLGSLMCMLDFTWSKKVPTAATNGTKIFWNPDFFISLDKEQRKFVLLHELWHVAMLHNIRGEGKDPEVWNQACDIKINNDLENEGFVSNNLPMLKNHKYDSSPEEDIYEDLIKKQKQKNNNFGSTEGDIMSPGEGEEEQEQQNVAAIKQTIINNVANAVQQAKTSSDAGAVPGQITEYLDKFLNPIIPWKNVLINFFTAISEEKWDWRRPNRRYNHTYMPSRNNAREGLEHLIYYLDVSGSIDDEQLQRFNSEVKYIQEVIRPQKLTLVQFDTEITFEKTFEINDPFEKIEITGRGGTDLTPVRNHILKNNPTAAVIFSDLWCDPMERLGKNIPVIWIVIDNDNAKVNFGKKIHINI